MIQRFDGSETILKNIEIQCDHNKQDINKVALQKDDQKDQIFENLKTYIDEKQTEVLKNMGKKFETNNFQ